jgi:hypothetical protein
MLRSIYDDIWNEGFKVSLSVIPCQSGINDLCVPPRERNTKLTYSILNNSSLIKYLKGKISGGQVEILQHGLHHRFELKRGEFSSGSNRRSIQHGGDIIEEAFGIRPKFFVPPGEDISSENLKSIKELSMIPICRNTIFDRFMRAPVCPTLMKKISFKLLMSVASRTFLQDSSLSSMKPVQLTLGQGFINWSLPSTKIRNYTNIDSLLTLSKHIINHSASSRSPICILNHYHSYFFDWDQTITRNDLYRVWIEIIRGFRNLTFVWKTNFKSLYERFVKINSVRTNQTGLKVSIRTTEDISDYSFLCSSPIERSSFADYDYDTKICTIRKVTPESQIKLYLKE